MDDFYDNLSSHSLGFQLHSGMNSTVSRAVEELMPKDVMTFINDVPINLRVPEL